MLFPMLEDNQNNNNEGGSNAPQSYSKSQKIASASLAFFAVLVIILWVVQFKQSINGPFEYKGESNLTTNSADQSDAASEEALKTKDTDSDGLFDWDELNTYKTSPYLEDSDSDGFNDKEEIDAGKDPNCPSGQVCSSTSTSDSGQNLSSETAETTQDNSTLNNLLNQMGVAAGTPLSNNTTVGNATGGLSQPDMQKMVEGSIDAPTLRQMLISAGMDKTILDKISDADLMASYQETMAQ
jgi:hypothetical protein